MTLPLWRRRQDQDLDEELKSHLAMSTRDRIERGESPDDAARHAAAEFGNVLVIREQVRDRWGWIWIEEAMRDAAYACRSLRRSPGFVAAAALTLALGIGANTAIFSVVHAVLLRPLPFPDPDRLVAVGGVDRRRPDLATGTVSWPDYLDWRTRAKALASFSAYHNTHFTITGIGEAQHVPGEIVSGDFFATLGVDPALGRAFQWQDEQPGSDVVVVSDAFWRNRLGGSQDIVGRALTINGRSFTVIGVMPRGFGFPVAFPAPEVWATMAQDARVEVPGDTPMTRQRGARYPQLVGRLLKGVTAAEAQAELSLVAADVARENGDVDVGQLASVTPALEAMVRAARQPLLLLLATVGGLLLIACVNVASLLTARGISRRRELALRAALGASRSRIVRLLLTESLVLSFVGAAIGVVAASWSLPLFVRLSPTAVRGLDAVSLSAPVVLFATAAAVVSALLFGVAPALAASCTSPGGVGGTRTTAGPAQRRLLSGLVVLETAIGVTLLLTATLLVRGFVRLAHTDPGFDSSHVLTMRVDLPDSRYPYVNQVAFYDRLLPDLARLPGVEAAAAIGPLPLSGGHLQLDFEIMGDPPSASPGHKPAADFGFISPGYFSAMRIPVRDGREFASTDDDRAPRVVVINDAFARQYLSDVNPIGKHIKPGLATTEAVPPWREIVGVVRDVKQQALTEAVKPTYFVPYAQGLITAPSLILRVAGAPFAIAGAAHRVITTRDPDLAVHDVQTMDEYLAKSIASPRFETSLIALFAALGLALAAIGLYGVLAYGVAQRTHELGVRLALGAQPRDLLGLVVTRALALAAAGLVIGLGVATFVARVLARSLDFVGPIDASVVGVTAAILVAAAVAAAAAPARRAAHVDPLRELRAE